VAYLGSCGNPGVRGTSGGSATGAGHRCARAPTAGVWRRCVHAVTLFMALRCLIGLARCPPARR